MHYNYVIMAFFCSHTFKNRENLKLRSINLKNCKPLNAMYNNNVLTELNAWIRITKRFRKNILKTRKGAYLK